MRRKFFVEKFDGNRAFLRGVAAHHAGRVLRAAPGQLYELSDGQRLWLARVEGVRRDAVEFALLEQLLPYQPALQIALLLSIVKFDRFEWALEKATELGVAEILPLAAARSEQGLIAAAPKRTARWERILLEAAQQSRRLRPPLLRPLERSNAAFLRRPSPAAGDDSELRLFFSEAKEAPSLRLVLADSPDSSSTPRTGQPLSSRTPASSAGVRDLLVPGFSRPRVFLAIGPEGGWTDEERRAAAAGHWLEVSLGPNVLRTETAVVAALAAMNYAWEAS